MKAKKNTPHEAEPIMAVSTELAASIPAPREMTSLQLCTNMDAVNALGQTLAKSGFFGQVSASTATAALVNCFLEGLTPLQYKAKYHTFDNGQTGVKSDYIQREFHRLGGKWKFNKWDAEVCDMTFTYQGETLDFAVTLEEFKANGVAMAGGRMKTNWQKFPREMLKARCMATAIRAICPEAMDGMYTQEEVADFDRPRPSETAPRVTPITPVKVSPSPVAEPAHVDPTVCPCGKVRGKRWSDLPTETLEVILSTPVEKAPALTADHRNAIIAELGAREQAEQDAASDAAEDEARGEAESDAIVPEVVNI